ncbi:MAG: hypothetical protein Q4D65_10295 [Peptostreptococcaceae bacterium]|nr:hypothetical protein [Peptostreptococcaceae bacterium]
MKKNMYSLMLSKSIMQEIDRLAYKLGTNRSNLINQILAEYISFETPEMKIREIFSKITQMIESTDFILLSEGNSTLSLKSPLEYKYRPTIKYSLELHKYSEHNQIGMLRVNFRTQSSELLDILDGFFHSFILLEKKYIHQFFPKDSIQYEVENGKFKRTFPMPNADDNAGNKIISEALSTYIDCFDKLLKWYLHEPDANFEQMEKEYLKLIQNKIVI